MVCKYHVSLLFLLLTCLSSYSTPHPAFIMRLSKIRRNYILMNLYWKVVPAARLILVDHKGLTLVYGDAESAGVELGLQEPSSGIKLAMVSPTTVMTSFLSRNSQVP